MKMQKFKVKERKLKCAETKFLDRQPKIVLYVTVFNDTLIVY